jgi:epoxyqueuosine reductase QueG
MHSLLGNRLKGVRNLSFENERGSITEILSGLDVDGYGTVNLDDADEKMQVVVRNLLPGAKSVVVLLQEVFRESVKHITSQASVGDMALRDLFDSNADIASGHLNWETYNMVRGLHKAGYKGLVLPAKGGPYGGKYLEGPVSYKKLAELAGLGFIGWNSLLLNPEYGPKVRLACIVTDAPFDTSVSKEDYISPCEKCGGACVKICPIKAIHQPDGDSKYVIDKYACNSYLIASGSCAECLKACPGWVSNG